MEYLFSILVVFNEAFSIKWMPDLMSLFSVVILLWYLVGRKKQLKTIIGLSAVFCVYALLVQIISGSHAWYEGLQFIIRTSLNITLMVWVASNYEKWKLPKLLVTTGALHGILTIVAFFIKPSILWKYDTYFTGAQASRLKLLYSEPATLSFICGLFLIICVYHLISQGFDALITIATMIFAADMLLSYGLGGMILTAIAIALMLMSYVANHRTIILEDPLAKLRWFSVFALMAVIVVMIIILSPIYGLRVMNLVTGKENGLYYTIQEPVMQFVNTMKETGWRGTGIYQFKATSADIVYSGRQILKNSFLLFMTEGGLLGVLLIGALIAYLLGVTLLYGDIITFVLMFYVVVGQGTSGYFNNPVNWFIYGIILYKCVKERTVHRAEMLSKERKNNDDVLNVPGYLTFEGKKENEDKSSKMKICLVGSSGGHLTHLYMLKPFWENKERFWVTFDKEDARSLLENERMIPCYYPTNRSLKGLIINTVLALRVLNEERPDVIISSGAAVAVPFFYIGKFLGAKCIYIEVYDRIDKSTMSGKMVYPIADKFIVQWDEMKKVYPKAINLGSIF